MSVPLAGEKFTPPTLSLADQAILLVEFAPSVRVTVQGVVTPQVLESKLVGLTDHVACCAQFHDAEMGLAAPEESVKVKVSFLHGIDEMVTCTEPPGVSVPLGGEKLTPPTLSLADQAILPGEAEPSVKVTVQVQVDLPVQLLVLKLVGLTDHVVGTTVGDGDGVGEGVGDGDGVGEGDGDGVGDGVGDGDGVGVALLKVRVTAI